MRRILIIVVCAMSMMSCSRMSELRLQKKLMPLAVKFLQDEGIDNYKDLRIKSIDTITEASYARLTSELLGNMEAAYTEMYYQEGAKQKVVSLYLNDVIRTKADMDELLEYGDLKTDGVLLYMVTADYKQGSDTREFMFLVNPDRKSLHTLDPFGDNLLYKE